jgi:DNA-binding transcriptional LysR family regulator
MAELTDWTLVRSFLAVIRRGSLSGAARATGLTQPTVGRHIDQLEQALGVALFTRSPGGLIPTEAARNLVAHAEGIEGAVGGLERAASASATSSEGIRGTVRVTASEIMGLAVLPSILAEVRYTHPGIALELALNNRTDDLLRRTADIAVRMVRPTQDGLVARRIGAVPLGFFAHKRYVDRFGAPQTLDDLARFHLIGFDRDDHSARAVAGGRLPITREIFAFRCDHDGAQMAALHAGLGIGLLQMGIARRTPHMVEVLPGALPITLECWLAVHEDQRNEPAIRATWDALAEGLTAWVGESGGLTEKPNDG